jgi:type IV pilus assembly protein PilW
MKNMRRQRGVTLVELMVSLLLGLIVIAGVVSVLVSNKRSYRTNEGLSQVQESARTAFELLARDIRQAGGTGCDSGQRMSNLLIGTANWWQTWASVRGYESLQADPAVAFGAGVDARVAGTDAVHLNAIEAGGFPLQTHSAVGHTMLLNNAAPTSLSASDIILACDFDHAAIFQALSYDGPTTTLNYIDNTGSPGNCSNGLGYPVDCGSATGNAYTFTRNTMVGRLSAVDWYVGNNPDGGRSLYRRRLGPGAVTLTEEVVAGVTNMQIRYGTNASDIVTDANGIVGATAWGNVNSVFITLVISSIDTNVSTNTAVNTGRLQRTFTYLVTLRNRVP